MNQVVKEKTIIVCSDSIGETADAVARATIRQFNEDEVTVHRFANIQTDADISKVIDAAKSKQAFIAYTLVQPELREALKREAIHQGIRTVDIMGPMMQAFIDTFDGNPLAKPGLLHQMDEDYFRRVEAIEFTVKYDDGKDTKGVLEADIVLIGISRTSKTPLSVFLAHKGYKVANIPLIPEVRISSELKKIPSSRIFGLMIDPQQMLQIRTERLKSLGLSEEANYASLPRITEELKYALGIMEQLGCKVVDVSSKAIEETANVIIQYLNH